MLKTKLSIPIVISSLLGLVSACGGKVIPDAGQGGSGGSNTDAGSGASGGSGGTSGSGGTGGAACQPLRGCSSNTRCFDGCNTCTCINGQWACTARACFDAGSGCTYSDPTKQYVSKSPDQCKVIDFACPTTSTPFFDDCGCGCVKEPSCAITECFRAVQCVAKCGGPVLQSGCCPCPSGTFDSIACPIDAGTPSCACAVTTVSWGMDGGLAAYVDSSSLVPCNTYVHERTTYQNATTACKLELTCNPGQISAQTINQLLAAPDVVAALKKAPIVYGIDPRPVDGQLFRVTVGSRTLYVGMPCNGAANCLPIPSGVAALVKGLQTLDQQALSRPECANMLAK